MKRSIIILLAVVLVGVEVGCKKSSSGENSTASGDTDASNNLPPAVQNAKAGLSNVWHNGQSVASNVWTDVKNGSTNAWHKTTSVASNVLTDTKDAATNAWSKVQNWFQSDTNSFPDYNYSRKDEFIQDMQTNLAILDQHLSELSERAADAQDSVSSALQDKIQALKDRRSDLDKKMDELKNATADQWNDAKAGFTKSYQAVKKSMKQVWDSISGNN